jgi:hypothetical protein
MNRLCFDRFELLQRRLGEGVVESGKQSLDFLGLQHGGFDLQCRWTGWNQRWITLDQAFQIVGRCEQGRCADVRRFGRCRAFHCHTLSNCPRVDPRLEAVR